MATKNTRGLSREPATAITAKDVRRVQSAVARQHDGKVPRDSYVGRMQRIVAKNSRSS